MGELAAPHGLAVLLGALGLACACGAPPPPPKPAAPAVTTSAERFLPLTHDTVFAYETRSEQTGETGLLVLEVRRPAPERAELAVAGNVTRLLVDDTGIRLVTGGWLLKLPLSLGATWPGDFGQVEVTAFDRVVETPAGVFAGCLETTEVQAGTGFSKKTATTYCPNVGIVLRRTEVESDEGSGAEAIRLRSHGPRFDISSP